MNAANRSPPSHAVELRHGAWRLALRPQLGGCVAGLWLGELPVLLSVEPQALQGPRPSAGYPLLPYSNRLGFRRFRWQGNDYSTAANFDGSPHSLHGCGWRRAWQVQAQEPAQATLRLQHAGDADWPFAFDATQRFRLDADGLELRMTITNTDARTQPVGLGWHPYFPKRERSRLHIEVRERWQADPQTQLPTHPVAQPGIDAPVRQLAFDHCFQGWQGTVRLQDEQLSLRLSSSLGYLVVFTPGDKPYYCVEPVSHVSNAIQMADPLAHGLVALAPGASFEAWIRLDGQQVGGAG